MKHCGRILGSAVGYRKICGGLWYGEVVRCEDCESEELRLRVLRKQEKLLELQLHKELVTP